MLQTSRIEHAGLYTEQAPVPLQGVSIAVEVLDVAADVTIKQTFKNTEAAPIEAVYCFPLEEGSAVYRFEAKIGERTIRGTVEERENAFERYDDALARGDGALLLDREKEDIFVASVGNLLPGQEIEICVRYVAELPVSDDLIHLIIPATVSPRYVPAGYDPLQADAISPPTQMEVPYRLALLVTIRDGHTLSEVASPSHAVAIDKTADTWAVSLQSGTTCLDRDFILDIRHSEPRAACAIIGQHANGDRAVMLRLYPEFDAEKTSGPGEVVFLLDCSGSMQGSSIGQATRVLELCLRSMSQGDYFNIVRFGSSYESLFATSMEYSDVSFEQALRYIRRIDADLGGTELVAPLRSILAQAPVCSGGRTVFVITDGETVNEEEAIALARRHRDTARIFPFGIGYGASLSLVRGLARVSGGMAEFVSPDEQIEDKVLRQFARYDSPCIRDIKVNWNGATVRQAPALIPPLFSGDSFTLYGLIERGTPEGTVELSGKNGSETILLTAPVTEAPAGHMLPLLWAKQAIRDLEDGTESGSQQRGRKTRTAKEKIIALSKRYQVLSSHTSFVAIETRSDQEQSTEAPQFRRIPVQLTRDWHGVDSVCFTSAPADVYTEHIMYSLESPENYAPCSYATKTVVQAPAPGKCTSSRISDAPMYDLLMAQTPAGWFELTDIISTYIGTSIKDLRDMALRIDGVDSVNTKLLVFATVITILILQEKEPAYQESWTRAVTKAQATLDDHARGALLDCKPVFERIGELFFS